MTATMPARTVPRLKQRYADEVRQQLKDSLGLANVMEVPRFEKVVINMGVGRATQQKSLLDGAVRDLAIITGQKPFVTKAKKSIAAFKLREGNEIGVITQTTHGTRLHLHVRRHRAADLPRDRVRQGRHAPRHGHHRGHHRPQRRRGTSPPRRLRVPVQA